MLEISLSGTDLVRQRHFRVLKFTGDSRDRGATLKVGKGGGGGFLLVTLCGPWVDTAIIWVGNSLGVGVKVSF